MKNLNATVGSARLDPETFEPFRPISASFRVYYELQQDGCGPWPTFEDYVDKALVEIKAEIMRQANVT